MRVLFDVSILICIEAQENQSIIYFLMVLMSDVLSKIMGKKKEIGVHIDNLFYMKNTKLKTSD